LQVHWQTRSEGALSSSAIDWVKANFLTCAKFITTPEYAPRLRRRRSLELELAEDAASRGWTREVERHGGTAHRINQLLCEMNEPLDGPVAAS
jgi:hypothetical protein